MEKDVLTNPGNIRHFSQDRIMTNPDCFPHLINHSWHLWHDIIHTLNIARVLTSGALEFKRLRSHEWGYMNDLTSIC